MYHAATINRFTVSTPVEKMAVDQIAILKRAWIMGNARHKKRFLNGDTETPKLCINCWHCTESHPPCSIGHDPKWRDCEGLQDHSWGFQGCTKFKDI